MKHSIYQKNILAKIGNGNIQIEAVAGSGKTTILVDAGGRIPVNARGLVVTFNKETVDNFNGKFPKNCDCSTLHALGFRALKEAGFNYKVNSIKCKNILKYKCLDYDRKRGWGTSEDKDFFYEWWKTLIKIVSFLKSECAREVTGTKVKELADYHCLDLPEDVDVFVGLVSEVYEISERQDRVIDFDDMILYPLIMNLKFPKYDYIFVDEAQDLNKAQRMLIDRLRGSVGIEHSVINPYKKGCGQVVIVGDSAQSVYGFRGASPDSMKEFAREFEVEKLPLNICYRCSKAVVTEAKKIVSQIEAREDAPKGVVESITKVTFYEQVNAGDFVLCRVNAPLVEVFLKLLEMEIPVKMAKSDAGLVVGLCDYVDKIKIKDNIDRRMIHEWALETDVKLEEEKKFYAKSYHWELINILNTFTGKYSTPAELKQKINFVFGPKNSKENVILSTIHRVKGLEANRVFIIRPALMPHPAAKLDWELKQEDNLRYVAITRAKNELYYVED